MVTSLGSGDGDGDDDEGQQGEGSALTSGAGLAPYTTSGSRGVFCPTWAWGRAACEPAIRLPGSFVDRRGERHGEGSGAAAAGQGGGAEGFEMEVEEDEESSKTEGEDIDDEEDHETVCGAKAVHGGGAAAASGDVGPMFNATEALHCCLARGGVTCLLPPHPMSSPPLPLHLSIRLNVTVLILDRVTRVKLRRTSTTALWKEY